MRTSPGDIPKTVIFCQTKDMVAAMYKLLRFKIPDCVSMFHASLTDETEIYSKFTSSSSKFRCFLSSIAFGVVSINVSNNNNLIL